MRLGLVASLVCLICACQGDPVGEGSTDSGVGGAMTGGVAGVPSGGGAGGASGGVAGAGGTAGSVAGGASGSGASGGASGSGGSVAGGGSGGTAGGGSGGTAGSGGSAGSSCNPSCSQELAPSTFAALDLAIDTQDVYFVSFSSVAKVKKTGGAPSSIASGSFKLPIGVDATHVYVFGGTSSDLEKIIKSGGTSLTLAASDGNAPQRLLLAKGYAYWTTYPGAVRRVAVTGGTPETLSPSGSDPYGLAVDDTYAWWSNRTFGKSVIRHNLTTKADDPVATGLLAPGDVAVDASNVYFADVNKILSRDKGNSAALTTAVPGILPDRIAVDGGYIYWASTTAKHVARAALAGGPVQVIAKGLTAPGGLAVDSTSVYFTNDGGVYRAAKDCCVAQQ